MLVLTGAAGGELKAQQVCQLVLRLFSGVTIAGYLKITAFLLQEALSQLPLHSLAFKIQLHGRGCGGIPPGPQVIHTAGTVAFKEGGTNGPHQGTFARFIGAMNEVQARPQLTQFEGLPELSQLFNSKTLEFHGWTSPAFSDAGSMRSRNRLVRIARASRDVAAFSSSALSCCSLNSPITSPR